MTAALEAGSQAVVYCVQAEDWDRLGGFAFAWGKRQRGDGSVDLWAELARPGH